MFPGVLHVCVRRALLPAMSLISRENLRDNAWTAFQGYLFIL